MSARMIRPDVIRNRRICWRKSNVCAACADEMEKMCENARERIWAELEGEKYLDLGSESESESDGDEDDESDGDDDDDDDDDEGQD